MQWGLTHGAFAFGWCAGGAGDSVGANGAGLCGVRAGADVRVGADVRGLSCNGWRDEQHWCRHRAFALDDGQASRHAEALKALQIGQMHHWVCLTRHTSRRML